MLERIKADYERSGRDVAACMTVDKVDWLIAEVERLGPIVAKLPKDVEGDPVEDCRSYFFPCANGAIEFVAYLGPRYRGDNPMPYPWDKVHKTREAAEKAKEKA